jgi:hypothetical protein
MKILKKFDSYIKEDLATMAEPAIKPSTTPAPATPTIEPGTKPERRDRPTPIRRDRPAVEPDPQAKMKMDATEEEGTYIGTQMIQDLADALGTEVIDNAVQYEGKTINFYSETEKFHVDKKKFTTVEEVVDYLTGGKSPIEKEMIETEEEGESMEDELEEEVEDLEVEFEDEEDIVRGRHIKEFENFMFDEEDSNESEYEGEEGEDEDDEYKYRVKSEKPEWMWNGEIDSEEVCSECGISECGYDHGADSGEECVPCRESHVTKKFNNFR